MNNYAKVALLCLACFIAGLLMHLPGCNGRMQTVKTETTVSHEPRTDTVLQSVITHVPVPYRVEVITHDSIYDTIQVPTIQYVPKPVATSRQRRSYYSDSLRVAGEFKAVINDTVDGRIVGRSIQWANLTPIEVRTTTKTEVKKSALFKVYLGAKAVVPVADVRLNRFDIEPELSLVIKDRYMLDAGYGPIQQQVHAGMKVKLSFVKE